MKDKTPDAFHMFDLTGKVEVMNWRWNRYREVRCTLAREDLGVNIIVADIRVTWLRL